MSASSPTKNEGLVAPGAPAVGVGLPRPAGGLVLNYLGDLFLAGRSLDNAGLFRVDNTAHWQGEARVTGAGAPFADPLPVAGGPPTDPYGGTAFDVLRIARSPTSHILELGHSAYGEEGGTIEFWIWYESITAIKAIMESDPLGYGFALTDGSAVSESLRIVFRPDTRALFAFTQPLSTQPGAGVWAHHALVWNRPVPVGSAQFNFYLNGAQAMFSPPFSGATDGTGKTWTSFGATAFAPVTAFGGWLFDVRIYDEPRVDPVASATYPVPVAVLPSSPPLT